MSDFYINYKSASGKEKFKVSSDTYDLLQEFLHNDLPLKKAGGWGWSWLPWNKNQDATNPQRENITDLSGATIPQNDNPEKWGMYVANGGTEWRDKETQQPASLEQQKELTNWQKMESGDYDPMKGQASLIPTEDGKSLTVDTDWMIKNQGVSPETAQAYKEWYDKQAGNVTTTTTEAQDIKAEQNALTMNKTAQAADAPVEESTPQKNQWGTDQTRIESGKIAGALANFVSNLTLGNPSNYTYQAVSSPDSNIYGTDYDTVSQATSADRYYIPAGNVQWNPLATFRIDLPNDFDPNSLLAGRGGFADFENALAYKEGHSDHANNNNSGFKGKYQLGADILRDVGVYLGQRGDGWAGAFDAAHGGTLQGFLNDENAQLDALQKALNLQWYYANNIKTSDGRSLADHIGETINGVKITPSGLISAIHLVGAGGVQNLLNGGSASDANGTTALSYLDRFGGYDLSSVVPGVAAYSS